MKKYSYFKRNGLSIVLVFLMLLSFTGQFISGYRYKNHELSEQDRSSLTPVQYAQSGHFIQATFENWESEFLQMALYVLLTVKLYQIGSAESKDPAKKEAVDRSPKAHAEAPWPVKKQGFWLNLYSNSLSIAFVLLFLISFILHFYGSYKNYTDDQQEKQLPVEEWTSYLTTSRFWFESFQNWQSEFLSVLSLVILSIWLRQKGSPESKPVDAPIYETGSS
ncbi:DUF6766 family protein [Gynurincola endophyticus]|uniref:DUF6766 family protein n=1 Tax=Gynurincola endophyticus TaxID=2479004 RepID=UPI000F8E21C5|nr:DUF6766 family protein [Gynurincola endophyticus]